jgi:hypothetical protein
MSDGYLDEVVSHRLAPDSVAVASLAGQIEMARATVEMLRCFVSRAAEGDPKLVDLNEQLNRIRHNLGTLDRENQRRNSLITTESTIEATSDTSSIDVIGM